MKTEALEAVRKPPYGELQKNLVTYLSSWSEVWCGHCQCHLFAEVEAHYPEVLSPCLWMGKKCQASAPGRGSLVLPERNQGKKLCVFKILLYVYKALGNRAKL